jgi:hypothetical protein
MELTEVRKKDVEFAFDVARKWGTDGAYDERP